MFVFLPVLPPSGGNDSTQRCGAKAVNMHSQEPLFAIEQDGQTLILSPIASLNELELSALDDAIRDVLQHLESREFRNLLLDFAGTDYYGSTALGFFIKLWKRVCSIDGPKGR